jgi:mono/diheme cytochrome c family protein
MMRRGWIALCFLAAVPQVALAEDHVLTEQQKLGWRLYETSCGICHTRPTLIAGLYGPELNKETAGGREDLVQGIVTNGTPRMPGFKYTYNPEQIAAIAAYLKTLPVGNQAPTVPPAARPPAPAQ